MTVCVGLVGLDQHPPRLVTAAGPAGDLADLLKGRSGRAQISAGKAKVGVDHPDQRQIGEVVALGDQLGADHDVDLLPLHPGDELGRPRGAPDGVGSDDGGARFREQRLHSSAMRSTPGPQATRLSLRHTPALARRRHDMAAMVAGEPAASAGARPSRRCSSGIGSGARRCGKRVSGAKPRAIKEQQACSPPQGWLPSSATRRGAIQRPAGGGSAVRSSA
jgi:hypothetical protein